MSLEEVHVIRKGKWKVEVPDTYFDHDMRYLGINPEENDICEVGCSDKIRNAYNTIERMEEDVHRLSNKEITRLYYHLFLLIVRWRSEKGVCGHQLFHRFKRSLDLARKHNNYNPAENRGITRPYYVALNMIMAKLAEDFIEQHD